MMRTLVIVGFCLISGLVLNGCLAALGTSNSVRVDGGMKYEYEAAERGGATHRWSLPEKRSINRIEIYFDEFEPLKNFIVYAQLGKNNWRVVKEVKTPAKTSPFTVSTALSTDAIRIVHSSTTGRIQEIALYGTEPKDAKFENIK